MKSNNTIHIQRLNNGIPVITINNTFHHSVLISWFINCGSLYDPIDRQGLAHFVEHMLFKGTKQHPSPLQLNITLDKYGAYSNAHTSQERTWYEVHIDAEFWEKGLETISEMMFDSIFPEKEITPEKEVVVHEIQLDDRNPKDILLQDSGAWVWSGTPYARPIGGTPDSVRSIQINDVLRFLGQYYQPHRMCLIIVGALPSQKKTNEIIKKYVDRKWENTVLGRARDSLSLLGNPQSSTMSVMNEPIWWPVKNQRKITNENFNEHVNLYRIGNNPIVINGNIEHPGFPGPAIQYIPYENDSEQIYIKIDFPVVDTTNEQTINLAQWLQSYLSDGMGSTLFVELREKRGLTYSVKTFLDSVNTIGIGTFSIMTSTNTNFKNVSQVITCIFDELNKLKTRKLPAKITKFYRQMTQGKQKLSAEDHSAWIQLLADIFFRQGFYGLTNLDIDANQNDWKLTQPTPLKEISKVWFDTQSTWITIVGPPKYASTKYLHKLAKLIITK